ncbi:hypothetical protein HWV62_24482 [Athelia sp. TMB]|nr:hypothetical protein HWV62_24482 [Athelia sp. TMB]
MLNASNVAPVVSQSLADDSLVQAVAETFDPPMVVDMELDDNLSLASRRGRRKPQLPAHLRDFVPTPLDPIEEHSPQDPVPPVSNPSILLPPSSPLPLVRCIIDTSKNIFGLFRRYTDRLPTHDPEEVVNLAALTDRASDYRASMDNEKMQTKEPVLYPFPNKSSFELSEWYWSDGNQKSQKSFQKLLRIVGAPDYKPEDIANTNWTKIHETLGQNTFDKDKAPNRDSFLADEAYDAGWRRKPISIEVPFHRRSDSPGHKTFLVGDFYHRSLIEVLREKLGNSADDQHFHYQPYELRWQPQANMDSTERVYGELYTSPAFLEAHNKLQDSNGEPGCTLERVVAAMMFASDATQLATYGTAKLWPLYLWFGNESKYRRGKPTFKLCHHVAYFQTLPDSFKDFATAHSGTRGPAKNLTTYCRRELFHTQWEVLLDDEFIAAYEHGIIVDCSDGIKRRWYPRVFTYSADYQEKIIVSCIRDKGQCPCPRCLVEFSKLEQLGSPEDMNHRVVSLRVDDENNRKKIQTARDYILKENHAVSSKHVEAELKEYSLTPTANAFSKRLAPLGFDIYSTLVVDLMHEFELGVWKGLFVHLLRILEAQSRATGTNLINQLDFRFRQIPSFGRDTIRRFSNNVSELKQLAARDYEDILQCAIPVFEGLLPEPHNSAIMELLFTCAHWHGLAKLRMHIDSTLTLLDEETIKIGEQLRSFVDSTCEAFATKELGREVAARNRRQKKSQVPTDDNSNTDSSPRPKKYNMRTIKHHFLGDHAHHIRCFGTADSISTEPGELEHTTSKHWFPRTSGKTFVKQMTGLERRETRIRRIRAKLYDGKKSTTDETLAPQSLEAHHHIAISQSSPYHIGTFLISNEGDPAIQDFVTKLKENILPRLLARVKAEYGEQELCPLPAAEDCDADNAVIVDKMYLHRIFHINYTSYDIRRLQDIVNAESTHCNIMVLRHPDDNDPSHYRYGRVIGTYHTKAMYMGPGRINYHSHRFEFLWVRWYQEVGQAGAGWNYRKLDRMRFAPLSDHDAFDIIDPANVLRGCHVLPRFSLGRKHSDGVGISSLAHDSSDWVEYYLNRRSPTVNEDNTPTSNHPTNGEGKEGVASSSGLANDNPEIDEGEDLEDDDPVSEDDLDSLGSDDGAVSDKDSLEWDEELVAEEMYED